MTGDATRAEPPGNAGGLTVGRTATLVGVSVRTLHHWDETGLVRPSSRTWAGYRVYSDGDIARIHRVLVYRELGFELAEIGEILDDRSVDAAEHLRRQRQQLDERITRLRAMAAAVDTMLAATENGIQLTVKQQAEIFGEDWRPEWPAEAAARWGDTPQWAQYSQRVAELSEADWKEVMAVTDAVHADLAAAKRTGVAPGSAEANALAERHRELMSTYFDCTHAMHVCMARMFIDEPGYADYYDAMEPGLTQWMQDAIFANAAANGVDPATAEWE